MRRLIIDVKYMDGWWRVEWRDFGRITRMRHKQLAVEFAVNQALTHHASGGIASVVVHLKNGRIQEERSFGSDPTRSVG